MARHYKTLYDLIQKHGWSWGDMQTMVPYELDIMVAMLTADLKAQRDKNG